MHFMIKESKSACLSAFMEVTILDIEAWPKSHVTVMLTSAFSGVHFFK